MEDELGCQGTSLLHNSVNLLNEERVLGNVSVKKSRD